MPQESTLSESTNEDNERAIEQEILDLQMKLLEAVKQLSYATTEVILLIPRREDNGEAFSISLSYVTRGSDAFEAEVTNELAARVERTIADWQKWVREQIEHNKQSPF